mmetsp:Transcript_10900/g.12355  ORF Transcript_10900/g.12355 Transcript_10900/m.12355 type:complete len:111 (+) Transcript_10900:31-363(+)
MSLSRSRILTRRLCRRRGGGGHPYSNSEAQVLWREAPGVARKTAGWQYVLNPGMALGAAFLFFTLTASEEKTSATIWARQEAIDNIGCVTSLVQSSLRSAQSRRDELAEE